MGAPPSQVYLLPDVAVLNPRISLLLPTNQRVLRGHLNLGAQTRLGQLLSLERLERTQCPFLFLKNQAGLIGIPIVVIKEPGGVNLNHAIIAFVVQIVTADGRG